MRALTLAALGAVLLTGCGSAERTATSVAVAASPTPSPTRTFDQYRANQSTCAGFIKAERSLSSQLTVANEDESVEAAAAGVTAYETAPRRLADAAAGADGPVAQLTREMADNLARLVVALEAFDFDAAGAALDKDFALSDSLTTACASIGIG